jgi:hypothetical protein
MFKPNVQYICDVIRLSVAGIYPATFQSPICAPATDALRA